MQDFKLLTRQLLETYLGSDTLSDVVIQNFLDSNASIIGTGKQEFFKNIEHFLNSFKFDVEKRKNIHFEFKDLEIEENIVDDQCVFVYGSVKIYGLYDKEVTIIHLDSRFTIIYGVRDGKWKVLHIHHSIPDKEQLEDEEFPITLGKQVQQARHEVEALSAGYSYICLINLETGDVELIKGNNIPGLNGRYTQTDHNILLEQVNRLIAKPFRKSSVEFYDSKTIAKRLEGKNSLFHTCERTDGTWILSMIVPQKYDENGRVVPGAIRSVFSPAFTIAVMLPIALCVFGPAGAFIGKYVVGGLFSLEGVAGFIGIGLIAALYPVLVMTGMHMVLITALFQVFATKGFDGFAAVAVSVSSFSIMGVGIGAFFRLKNKEQKALALSYGITAIVAGTSEPTIYGICTKYKKPFIGLLAGGFIGGAYAGLTGVIDATLVPSSNVFAALCFLGKSQANVVNGIIACVIAFVSTALLVYFFGFDKNEKDIQA